LAQNIGPLEQGEGPGQIRLLSSALLDQLEESSGNPEVRNVFRRYAINENNRQIIERDLGASVGRPDFSSRLQKDKAKIGDNIFRNTSTIEAAQRILPKQDFDAMLGNWLAEYQAKFTDNAKNGFSSNNFGSFLKRNQQELNVAFKENYKLLDNILNYTTAMRILPDAVSVNPSGTALTAFEYLTKINPHALTWEGILASLPKKVLDEVIKVNKMNKLNEALAGQTLKNAEQSYLKKQSEKLLKDLDLRVKKLINSSVPIMTRQSNER
jgi:hypothetical protein